MPHRVREDLKVSGAWTSFVLRALEQLGFEAADRRLAEEGASFRDVVEDARPGLALEASSDGLTIVEAAHKTGFSDVRPFKRAFRRWTGMTPTEFAGSA